MGFLRNLIKPTPRTELTKIFFASDLHGSNKTYKKFLNAYTYYDVDVLILGGDLTGKAVVPIIKQNGGWRVLMPGQEEFVQSTSELKETETQIENNGNYPHRISQNEYSSFKQNDEQIDAVYHQLQRERLHKWIAWAEEKLDENMVIYSIIGNDDEEFVSAILNNSDKFVMVDNKVMTIPEIDHEILGYGYSNPTPWDTPREKREPEIRRDLQKLGKWVDDWSSTIVNIHVPPKNSQIDEAPKLDEEHRVKTKGGRVVRIPVGSESVREFIEKHQPMLGLHGHIHESKGKYEINNTLCLNPGSEYGEGMLNGVIITLHDEEQNSIANYQFTSG